MKQSPQIPKKDKAVALLIKQNRLSSDQKKELKNYLELEKKRSQLVYKYLENCGNTEELQSEPVQKEINQFIKKHSKVKGSDLRELSERIKTISSTIETPDSRTHNELPKTPLEILIRKPLDGRNGSAIHISNGDLGPIREDLQQEQMNQSLLVNISSQHITEVPSQT